MESGLIRRLAPRLGIAEPEEYLRLSHVKCVGLSALTTETSNAVMCLDLAASCMKCPLDRAYLIKLSGLNKKIYQSCLKSFECLLGLNSNIGIRDLAVQFSCTEAVNLASKILQSYESSLPQTQQVDLDLSRPLFTTAALLSACKILKKPRFWVRKIPWRMAWQSTPVFLPEESHGQRSLVATVHGVA
uniref:Origin recognition complex subunit 6 n=1 Tax=Moschus moschiferus TaxID=68415 RepID=A0A8C6CRF7_MOSMO